MSQYFPKQFGEDISVKVNLLNYTTKADIKNISQVDTSSFALKTNLTSLKTEVDKLISVLTDLSKLNNVVKIKEKVINYMSDGKVMIIHLAVELIKKI